MMKQWMRALKQLHALTRQAPAYARHIAYPGHRAFIHDVMAEGRRKNIINLLLEVDVTVLKQTVEQANAEEPGRLSLTACIAFAFAQAIDADKGMHAYRDGGKRTILFEEIDIAVMVEREIDGAMLPVPFILRHAASKHATAIREELHQAQETAIGTTGPMSALDRAFFSLPLFLRKIIWIFIRRDPQLFKQLIGTVGLTSMGMHGSGSAVCIPITPMTLTLSIGTIGKRLKLMDKVVEREILQLNLGADHDLIDGVPLMRFAENLKNRLEDFSLAADQLPTNPSDLKT